MQTYFETAKLPLLAADFDYFRIPRERWDLLLTRLWQVGVEALILTVPWGFHEFARGTIDLNGATNARRDLEGVLNLCAAFELQCILKPGPYCNQGVLGAGIPLWLLKEAEFETALPAAVEGWYKALSKPFVDRQWPEGPVIALAIDAEPDQDTARAHSRQLTEVKWRIWLRKRYPGIEALNEAYGTDYRTVNDVDFPLSWAEGTSQVEKDAKEFLEKVRLDLQTRFTQTLTDAGWQVPTYPSVAEIYPDRPAFQPVSLLETVDLSSLKLAGKILHLQHPIEVEPDPVDVGQGPVWARGAPIRMDGSLRQSFWPVRQALWGYALADTSLKSQTFQASFDSQRLVTRPNDAALKLEIRPETEPAAFRLRLDGELVPEGDLKIKRGKLSGSYRAEDETGRTDLLVVLDDPGAPLFDFPSAYLRRLLLAQARTLARSAALAGHLAGSLTDTPPETAESVPPEPPAQQTLSTLEEARRGLSSADAALRKAMAAIGGLEDGFATILGESSPETPPQPATRPLISPELFEGKARQSLIEISAVCNDLVPPLNSAASALRQTTETTEGFTIEQYRQSYAAATATAREVLDALAEIIARLRLEIASERLPLVLWRVHDQVQELAESLRWGVLRR